MMTDMPAVAAILTGVLGALLLAGPGPVSPGSYEALIRQATEALAHHDPASGLAAVDRALRLQPEGAEAFMVLGRTYVELSRYEDAASAFRRAADLLGHDSPGGLEALVSLADALAREELNQEATAVLDEVLSIDPRRPAVHYDLGMIHLVLGELAPAADEFRKEIALHADVPQTQALAAPDSPLAAAYQGLGVASYRLGDDDTALDSLSRAPDTIETRYNMGLVLARRGEDEKALAQLREVLARDPDHRGALQALSRVAGALGLDQERKEALGRFQTLYEEHEAERTRSNRVEQLRDQANRKATAGDLDGAVAALDEAVKLVPDDVDVLMDLGRWLMLKGNAERSEEVFRAVLARDPLQADAYYRLGRILGARGDVDAGVAALEQATRLVPMALSYHVYLAQFYLRQGRAEDGVRELRLARRLAPDDPESSYNLGVGLAQAGSLQEAAAELESAVERGYANPRVHQVLAQIYQALGDTERSRKEQDLFEKLSSGDGVAP